jgi:hypothetical protein
MTTTSEYRLVLPTPWELVKLDATMPARVSEIVGRAVERLPREVPPDQIAPHRHRLERELLKQLEAARANGGVDYYLPTDLMHGQQLNANFVVSVVVPDATTDEGLVPKVLATLLQGEGTRAVSVGDTVWSRRERVLERAPDDFLDARLGVRKVEYLTAVPGDHRKWVIVTFTTLGDGNPDSEATHLVVELFDAIMSTWRWMAPASPEAA